MIINQNFGISRNELKKSNQKESKNEAGKTFDLNYSANNLVKPSIQNIKANVLSFGDNDKGTSVPINRTPTENHTPTEEIVLDLNKIGLKNLNEEPNLLKFKPYEKTAEKIAVALSSGKHINLTYGQGSKPEILAETFTQMLKEGKFENLCLNSGNTDVDLCNPSQLLSNKISPLGVILKNEEKATREGRKYIVFVQNFPSFKMISESSAKKTSNILFESKIFENINLIGITPREVNKEWMDFSNPRNSREDKQWLFKSFKRIDLLSPSSDATKKLLKNFRVRKHLLPKDSKNINFSDKSIDLAVEVAATCAGESPGKEIELLNLAVAAKKCRINKPVKAININDIKAVFKTYPDFRERIVSDSSQFEVITKPKERLTDVGGVKNLKEKIQTELLEYIKNPDKYKAKGAKIPKGVLLQGPPGTGKTLLAKAIAGEADVPFISCSASNFVEKFVGTGASRVRELFNLAETEARKHEKKTAMIFIDELDAVGKKRGDGGGDGGNTEREQTLNELLVQMDGLNKHSDVNIVILAATNLAESLDGALKRPGRFDRIYDVPNPSRNKETRREILEIHSRGKIFKDKDQKKAVLDEMAETTDGMSGAELEGIMGIAAMNTCKPDRKIPYITINDLQEAKLQQQFGLISEIEQPDWAIEKTVGHECGHALGTVVMTDAGEHPWTKPIGDIDAITLEPRGEFLGAVIYKPSDNTELTFESMIARLVSGYSGCNTEKMMYGSHAHGVSSDLENATELAHAAVTKWGLGPSTGVRIVSDKVPASPQLTEKIDTDVQLITDTANVISEKIVKFHKGFIDHYVGEYNKNKDNGGNNLSGHEFKNMYKNWVEKTGNQQKLEKLHKEIREIIKDAKKGENPKMKKGLKMGFGLT